MSSQGQINESTERWRIIQNLIVNNNFNTILEIGTCTGMGSTLSILKSMNQKTRFISIESDESFFDSAKKNLENYIDKFELIYGRIISIDDVNDFVSTIDLDSVQNTWLISDLDNFRKCPDVNNLIPEVIDFLLLDGGEFSTYKEWEKLKNTTKFVGLDDIRTIKCSKIYSELSGDENYSVLSMTNEGNGFCIFKKND